MLIQNLGGQTKNIMVFPEVAYRFRTPSLELKRLETSFGWGKTKVFQYLGSQHGCRVIKAHEHGDLKENLGWKKNWS